jgi:hypothetical protein
MVRLQAIEQYAHAKGEAQVDQDREVHQGLFNAANALRKSILPFYRQTGIVAGLEKALLWCNAAPRREGGMMAC